MALLRAKPSFELADILLKHQSDFEAKHQPNDYIKRVLNALKHCRTAVLGGHVDGCSDCGHLRISYNSCRNRHCPKCQVSDREVWIAAREQDLLPVRYFHVVFTLPHELNPWCIAYPKAMYDLLFEASAKTIQAFAKDSKHLGAKTGMISILHTWGQNLSLHPHIHMIVPGGGIDTDNHWKPAKSNGSYLFPVRAMSVVFKNKFLEGFFQLEQLRAAGFDKNLRQQLYAKSWVVYAKQPFAGPKQVVEYLGRYSHKIAISNHRIQSLREGKVTFRYKDYADQGKQKTMSLEATEFLRRFCLHILPAGFRKIRHYGILASRCKPKLKIQQWSMGIKPSPKLTRKEVLKQVLNYDTEQCPCCKTGKMIRLMQFDANAPPNEKTLLLMRRQLTKMPV